MEAAGEEGGEESRRTCAAWFWVEGLREGRREAGYVLDRVQVHVVEVDEIGVEMAEEDFERGYGGGKDSGVEHRDQARRRADAERLDSGSDRNAQKAAWRKLIVAEVEGLQNDWIDGGGAGLELESIDTDPVRYEGLDRLIIQALERLVLEGVEKPLAAMAAWCVFQDPAIEKRCSKDSEFAKGSDARRAVSYRICCSSALLGQYRWLAGLIACGKYDLDSKMGLPESLFEKKNDVGEQMTLRGRFEFVRRHLAMRGILKQRPKGA